MGIRIQKLLASAVLTAAVVAPAARYRPPLAKNDSASPNAWFVKRSAHAAWCSYRSFAAAKLAVQAGAAEEDYEAGETASIRYRGTLIQNVFVTKGSEDAIADDVYYFDKHQRVSKMVRTGHYVRDPAFTVTFIPGGGGKLTLTPVSKTVVHRMNDAGYDPYIIDWPTYSSFRDMPFRFLVERSPSISVQWGCVPRNRR